MDAPSSRPAHGRLRGGLIAVCAVVAMALLALPSQAFANVTAHTTAARMGELDCNGQSPIQRSLRMTMNCTDIRGFSNVDNSNTWGGRFYDNGEYIGHDEPDMTFLSSAPGSGENVTWTEQIPRDPAAAPTVKTPGSDVAHWFELSPAPWFSMAQCDPKSYPQLPCSPGSDANAPTSTYHGGGSAFMEMQLYPPGFAPFQDAISCDNTHWCSALTIDSLACTYQFASCNQNCEEPVNFAYIQTNGVPTGPVAPNKATHATFTANAHTLLMNPGDVVTIHMFDAPVPGGGGARAFKVVLTDSTTGQTGFMQASAANGFANSSIADCSSTPFNFQPEYNTAAKGNITPWAALQTDISTQFETGHFEPCTSVTKPGSFPLSPQITDTYYNVCHGPYEAGSDDPNLEPSDAFCYPKGDTHGAVNTAPDEVTGCTDGLFQNGDLDFDGTPYWPEWPTGAGPTSLYPGSFVQGLPTTAGSQYKQFFIQTDLALSESTCNGVSLKGCAVPAPNSPGGFYPYWSRASNGFGCFLEFGNVSSAVNDFGQDAQYGTDRSPQLGYPEFEGPVMSNACNGSAGSGQVGAGLARGA